MANSKIEEAAEKYAIEQMEFNKWLRELTDDEAIHLKTMLNEFALSDAAKEYWFEFNKYEGYENWNDERDCLKGEVEAYRKIISELDKELAQLKHQDKLEFRYYKELFDDLLTILNERRNKYALQGAHEWKIEGYDLAVKVVKSTLLDAEIEKLNIK